MLKYLVSDDIRERTWKGENSRFTFARENLRANLYQFHERT